MKSILSCLFVLLASPLWAQTQTCTIAEKVGSYANGDKKIGLRCPTSTPGAKGDTLDVSRPATTWRPLTSAAFTDALAHATGGDTILLAAGVTYAGAFQLPVHRGDDWVTVQTTAALPLRRLTDADASQLARLVSTQNGTPTITMAPGAHHWRLIGLDITQTGGNTYGIVRCGSAEGYTSLAQVPHHIELDRVYVHVPETMEERRGVQVNCNDFLITRSIVNGMHETGADSQAIGGWDAAARVRILDNDIMAASEPVLFGGGASSQVTPVPEDIEIRGNHIWKPQTWKGKPWNLKNLFELKNARRVLVTDNLFEGNYPGAQTGWSIVLTARGAESAPWMILEDITFEGNLVKDASSGIDILGLDDETHTHPMIGRRFTIRNNLIVTNEQQQGGDGWCYMLLGGAADVVIDHNTCIHGGGEVLAVDAFPTKIPGFVFTNNLQQHGTYGIFGTGVGSGLPALAFFDQPVVAGNVFADCGGAPYPAGNQCVPLADFLAQFNADWTLKDSSSYKGAGTDGKDLGASLP